MMERLALSGKVMLVLGVIALIFFAFVLLFMALYAVSPLVAGTIYGIAVIWLVVHAVVTDEGEE